MKWQNTMNWLYIHFSHLYAETWLPNFHGKQPAALMQAHGQTIEDVNASAKSRGIDVGMSLNTAFCLCPTLPITIQEAHRQQQALQRVAVIASRYSAWVSPDAPAGLYLEIASMKKLLGAATRIQQLLQTVFLQKGYHTIIAAAPQPKAARLLARAGQQRCYRQDELIQHLRNIPITALGLEEKIELRLLKLGMRQVHDLAQLPSSDLNYRIDAELALHLDHIVGRKPWLPPPFQLPERFCWTMDLEQDFESLEPLRFFLANGISQFCTFLQRRSLAARVLQLTLLHRQHDSSVVPINLASVDNRPESWQYMLTSAINRLQLPAPVTAIRLSGSLFEVLTDQERHLFKSVTQECSEKKTLLLNRLSARLGIQSLHFLQLTTDPRPEQQTRYHAQPNAEIQQPSAPFNLSPLKAPLLNGPPINAPLWLLPQPQAVDNNNYLIQRGPLRLATGWWDQCAAFRDYYIACDGTLSTQWLFLTPSGQWYQHGWFA